MVAAIGHCAAVAKTGAITLNTQDKPASTETVLTAHDIKCLQITEIWLENNRIDGGIPKDAKIEHIKFIHTGDTSIAWVTLSGGIETHVQINHRPIFNDIAFK